MEKDNARLRFVRGLDILSVIEREVGKLSPSGPDYTCLCPFHKDRSKGNFKVSPARNKFHCFACGEGGDSIDFIQKYYDLSLNDAIRYLANAFGFSHDEDAPAPVAKTAPQEKNVRKKGSAVTLNAVYEAFYESSDKLTPRLRKYLAEERHLSEAEMKDFFSFPGWRDDRFWRDFEKRLKDRNLGLSALLMVPGFYIRKPDNAKQGTGYYSFVSYKDSYGILCRNAEGQIVGIQVGFYKKKEEELADETKGRPKYLWFSSGNVESKGWGICGIPSGSPYDILYPTGKTTYPSIVITEGKYKSMAFAKTGMTVINIHGVSNLRNLKNQVTALDEKAGRKHTIVVGLDADIFENGGVAAAAKQITSFFADTHKVYIAYWDKLLGKGFDDLVNNGNYASIKKMQAPLFVASYIDPLLEKEKAEKAAFKKN